MCRNNDNVLHAKMQRFESKIVCDYDNSKNHVVAMMPVGWADVIKYLVLYYSKVIGHGVQRFTLGAPH